MLRTLIKQSMALSVLASVGACSLMPALQLPGFNLPAAFSQKSASVETVSKTSVPAAALGKRWWELYQDPVLNQLIDQTLASSPDVALLAARLQEAQANARDASASQLPQIDLGASVTRSQVSTLGSTVIPAGVPVIRNNFRLALSTAFELDFFGKLSSAAEGARAQLLATGYAQDTAVLSLAASVAQTYFLLRTVDQQLTFTQESLANRDAFLDLVKRRAAGGVASDLEVNQAIAARAQLAVQLRDLALQRAQAQNLLALLTGQPQLQLPTTPAGVEPVTPVPPVGLPSELLLQRPDIAQAEQAIVVSNAKIGIAKANLFPSISLTSSLGGESRELSDVTKPGAKIFSAGFGLTLPIFDAGRLNARADAAIAQQQQAVASYQKTVQTAFKEVQDALAAQRERGLAQDDGQARVSAAREAMRIAQVRYEAGYSGYLDVLDAQRTLNDAEISYLQNRYARLQASIDLMKALGGGWAKPS